MNSDDLNLQGSSSEIKLPNPKTEPSSESLNTQNTPKVELNKDSQKINLASAIETEKNSPIREPIADPAPVIPPAQATNPTPPPQFVPPTNNVPPVSPAPIPTPTNQTNSRAKAKAPDSWQNQPAQAVQDQSKNIKEVGASGLSQIRTYQGDIANTIKGQDESLYSIQQAEKAKQGIADNTSQPNDKKPLKAVALVVGSFILVGAGIAGAWYSYNEYQKRTEAPEIVKAPNIFVKAANTRELVAESITRSDIINFVSDSEEGEIPDGEVVHLQILESKEPLVTTSSQSFFSLIEARAPGSLTRAMDQLFMLGAINLPKKEEPLNIIEYAVNTASSTNQSSVTETSTSSASTTVEAEIVEPERNSVFMLIKIEDFENAYAGMLEWEEYMLRDLGPLLSTRELAANTDGNSQFEDIVSRNKDARAIKSPDGKIVVLYSFFDTDMLIITDNEETLKTLISRLTSELLSR